MKALWNITFALLIMIVPFILTFYARKILYQKVELVLPYTEDLLRVRKIPIDMSYALNSAVLYGLRR